MTRNRRTGSDTTSRILRHAAALYRGGGYEATTIRDIAAAVDVKSASLYYHFDSKADILFTILEEFHRTWNDALIPGLFVGGDVDAVLRSAVEAHIRFEFDHLDESFVTRHELQALPAKREEEVNRLRRMYADAFRWLVTRAGEDDPVRSKITTHAILDLLNGLPQWYDPAGAMGLDAIIARYQDFAVALLRAPVDAETRAVDEVTAPG